MAHESLHFTKRGLRPRTWFVLLMIVSIALLITDSQGSMTLRVRQMLWHTVAPVQSLMVKPLHGWETLREWMTKQDALVKHNQQLIERQAQLSAQLTRTHNQAREIAELKDLLQLKEYGLPATAAARVIRTGTNEPSDLATLDQGSKKGVTVGSAVVDGYGLVGQIVEVNDDYSLMRWSNHPQQIFSVTVARTGFHSLLYGDGRTLDLRYFPVREDLRVGDMLITSGLDHNYPAGLPVAQVDFLQSAEGTPYYDVGIRPLGQIHRAQYVLIVPKDKKI